MQPRPLGIKILSWVLVAVIVGGLAVYVSRSVHVVSTGGFAMAKQHRLEQAILAVEANLGSLFDVGYVSYTPEAAADQLVTGLNTAQMPVPGEEEELRQAGVRLPSPTTYVLYKPTGPWQVVLVPNDAAGTIRVEGYGQNLSEPLIVKELHVGY